MRYVQETGEIHTDFVGKTEETKPFGRSRRRWEDNINIDLQAV
jgi:hypothetical protein